MSLRDEIKHLLDHEDVNGLLSIVPTIPLDLTVGKQYPILHFVLRRGGVKFAPCHLSMLDHGFAHDEVDLLGRTPLLVAAQYSTASVVQSILSMGVKDVNIKNRMVVDRTPLMFAFGRDDAEMAAALLAHGADMAAINFNKIPAANYIKGPRCKVLMEHLRLGGTLSQAVNASAGEKLLRRPRI